MYEIKSEAPKISDNPTLSIIASETLMTFLSHSLGMNGICSMALLNSSAYIFVKLSYDFGLLSGSIL